ncbi:MAG: hypothetical protein CMH62_01570 [Nanoarchaeota archaeon]|mgnify:FL=1|jgi:hypothetical protein|nr:hypothetical protein [Nanoarchaeota archaeon]|tara:strand:- start:6567 stop:7034 length:468 start_codon:yes stop_codon:yes gene_type:complete
MSKQQINNKNYDLLRSKFSNTNELVKICDDFRRYKDSINGICEAILDIDKSDNILSNISVNIEVKVPKDKDNMLNEKPNDILNSLADANSPEEFMRKLGRVDKYMKKNDRVKLDSFHLDLKSLPDKALIAILMRTRDVIEKELEECINKFDKLFK